MAGFPSNGGGLLIRRWAERGTGDPDYEQLLVPLGPRPVRMAGSPATGEALVSNGALGMDVIRLSAGEGFAPHTYPSDHLLIVVGGAGTITLGGLVQPTQAGEVYLVPGAVPHAVGAITAHVILAVGSPHTALDHPERMQLVAYQAVTAELGNLHCLVCDRQSRHPARLHDVGCPHCPCGACVGTGAEATRNGALPTGVER